MLPRPVRGQPYGVGASPMVRITKRYRVEGLCIETREHQCELVRFRTAVSEDANLHEKLSLRKILRWLIHVSKSKSA